MLKTLFDISFSLLVVLFIVAVTAIPVFYLWNWIAVSLFAAPSITYVTSIGLTMLCDLLFKGHLAVKMPENGKD